MKTDSMYMYSRYLMNSRQVHNGSANKETAILLDMILKTKWRENYIKGTKNWWLVEGSIPHCESKVLTQNTQKKKMQLSFKSDNK